MTDRNNLQKADFAKVKELENKYYMPCFNRQNICIAEGNGALLYDINGKEYIDLFGGIATSILGYNHPALTKAISEQAAKLIHISNIYYTEIQSRFCEKLIAGSDFDRVFLCNSGAEANEGAIKLARKYFYKKGRQRSTIVTMRNSFHGRTLATAAATGQSKYSAPFAPLPERFVHTPFNDIRALMPELTENTAAIIVETIQGEGGVVPADYDFLVTAYALAKSKDILFIIDEIQTGMGRTGTMFSYEQYGIKPDIITLAKGLGGGMPMGAVLARGEAANAFAPGDHGSTFGGNPLACAAGLCVQTELKDNKLLEKAAEKGEYLSNLLMPLKKYNFVNDVRGRGLLLGIELAESVPAPEIVAKMAQAGVLLNACGRNTLRFAPPYVIGCGEIDKAVFELKKILDKYNV